MLFRSPAPTGTSQPAGPQVPAIRPGQPGAQPIEIPTGPMELRLPAIKGIGGAPLYLIDRFEDGKSIYDIDFDFVEQDITADAQWANFKTWVTAHYGITLA